MPPGPEVKEALAKHGDLRRQQRSAEFIPPHRPHLRQLALLAKSPHEESRCGLKFALLRQGRRRVQYCDGPGGVDFLD